MLKWTGHLYRVAQMRNEKWRSVTVGFVLGSKGIILLWIWQKLSLRLSNEFFCLRLYLVLPSWEQFCQRSIILHLSDILNHRSGFQLNKKVSSLCTGSYFIIKIAQIWWESSIHATNILPVIYTGCSSLHKTATTGYRRMPARCTIKSPC